MRLGQFCFEIWVSKFSSDFTKMRFQRRKIYKIQRELRKSDFRPELNYSQGQNIGSIKK